MEYGIPEIYESEATGVVKEVYEDIKCVLKVPIVNFIFRALAHYPDFLVMAWQQVRPNLLTLNFEQAAHRLRQSILDFQVPAIAHKPSVQETIAVFHYVNPKLLLIANVWSECLGGRYIYPKQAPFGFIEPGYIPKPISLVDISMASGRIQKTLKDIAQTHHAYDVASDYRAIARYPSFFQESWAMIKPFVQSTTYSALKSEILSHSIHQVHQSLPYEVILSKDHLQAKYGPACMTGIMGLVALFQNFLPGLMIEVEYMKKLAGM